MIYLQSNTKKAKPNQIKQTTSMHVTTGFHLEQFFLINKNKLWLPGWLPVYISQSIYPSKCASLSTDVQTTKEIFHFSVGAFCKTDDKTDKI